MGFTATHFKDANDDKYFEIKINKVIIIFGLA